MKSEYCETHKQQHFCHNWSAFGSYFLLFDSNLFSYDTWIENCCKHWMWKIEVECCESHKQQHFCHCWSPLLETAFYLFTQELKRNANVDCGKLKSEFCQTHKQQHFCHYCSPLLEVASYHFTQTIKLQTLELTSNCDNYIFFFGRAIQSDWTNKKESVKNSLKSVQNPFFQASQKFQF